MSCNLLATKSFSGQKKFWRLFILTLLYTGFVHAQTSSDLTTGLIGWWKFDDASGLSAGDSSGNGNTGTLTGGFPGDNSEWVTGKMGGALSFGASSNTKMVTVNQTIVSNTQDGSYSLWFYELESSPNGSMQMFLDQLMGGNNSCYGLYYQNGAITYMYMNSAPGSSGTYTYDMSLKWTHLAVTWNSTNVYLYVNSTLVSTGPRFASSQGIASVFSIGNNVNNSYAQSPHGYFDDVRVYNKALSSNDVYDLYEEGLAGWGYTPAINNLPIVNAGKNQSLIVPISADLPVTTTLSGSAVDEDGSTLTTRWNMISGPGLANFGSVSV